MTKDGLGAEAIALGRRREGGRLLNALMPRRERRASVASAHWLFVRIVVSRDWRFLTVTLVACAVAATVASFQYSVFTSFLRAGAVIPRAVGADFWIVARSVECFDFPNPISEDYARALARYVPHAQFRRVVFGFAPWRSPTGKRGNVAIVGVDASGLSDGEFAADQSDLKRLDIDPSVSAVVEGSIADTTLQFSHSVSNLPTFLGAPYVLVSFDTGRRLLRMDPSSTSFLAGDFDGNDKPDVDELGYQASKSFPDVALVSGKAFERSSSRYWQTKTGAGAAILLAAVLAAVLMVILLSNGIGRFIQRYHQDLLSLLGHGASEREISMIVVMVALLIATVTLVAAMLFTPLAIALCRPLLPWVFFRLSDTILPILAIVAAIIAAILSSRRAVAAFGPEAVFRS